MSSLGERHLICHSVAKRDELSHSLSDARTLSHTRHGAALISGRQLTALTNQRVMNEKESAGRERADPRKAEKRAENASKTHAIFYSRADPFQCACVTCRQLQKALKKKSEKPKKKKENK